VEAPLLQQIYEDYKDDGVMVLAIGIEQSQAQCQAWVEAHGITHPVLRDATRVVWNLFGMGYVPHNAVMDCEDIVLYTNYGFNEGVIRSHTENALLDVISFLHSPQIDTEDIMTPIDITAQIVAGSAFAAGSPELTYRVNGAMWTTVTMTNSGGNDYTGTIPGQASDSTVDYYLYAEQFDGCDRRYPMGDELYSFYIGPDVIPPVIDHTHLPLIADTMLPMVVTASVTDNIGVDSVTLEYQVNGGGVNTLPMTDTDGSCGATIPDTLGVGDVVSYRIIAVDQAAVPNTSIVPETGWYDTEIIERMPAIVIDLDRAHNSGPTIRTHVEALAGACDYETAMPATLGIYKSAFVCLGIYSTNYALTNTESDVLVALMETGGRVYMEGGDTWAYDTRTEAHGYFKILGVSDGYSDAGPQQNGMSGTFTAGMNMTYNTASTYNNYVDRINITGGSYVILQNSSPVYSTAIAYDGGTYKTVGSSIKFSGLSNGSTTVAQYMESILVFFDIIDPPTPTPIPTHTPTPIPTNTPTQGDCVNHGDTNLDGVLTAGDAQMAFQIVLGSYTPTYEQECAADCTGDGIVTAGDAQAIFLSVLGMGTCADPL
jgi:hypothetical protein